MKLKRNVVFGAAILALAAAALAQKTSIQLPRDNSLAQIKPGPGSDVVQKDCGFCHSTDYIVIQPRVTAQQWDAEVKKMIAVYGAPLSAADAKTISDYLVKNYAAENSQSTKAETRKP